MLTAEEVRKITFSKREENNIIDIEKAIDAASRRGSYTTSVQLFMNDYQSKQIESFLTGLGYGVAVSGCNSFYSDTCNASPREHNFIISWS